MDVWEKLKVLSSLIAAIVIPVVIIFVGNQYSQAIKEREVQGRFVELAVEILQAQPTEENKNIRTWATKVINAYSGVLLDTATTKDLIEKSPISMSRGRILMPMLLGMNLEEARTILLVYGLSVDVRQTGKGGVPPGTVLSQQPRPGIEVEMGSRVLLEVAVPPK